MIGKRAVILITLILLAAFSIATAGETYFKFRISSPEELSKLTRTISIDNVKGGDVFAYANERELLEFENLGYSYEVLPRPSTLIQPKMATTRDGMKDWDSYPSYDTYVSMMYEFETNYPGLCEIISLGYTVEGR